MPPLMGAGAFVMVELTGIPYTSIIIAALFPAILYFFSVWVGINAFLTRYGLSGLKSQDRPNLKIVLITGLFFSIPFIILLERMFLGGYTPQFAASLAILAACLMLLVDSYLSFSWRRTLKRVEFLTINSGKQIAMIASIIVCASIIVGVLGQTGLGIKITSFILSASGQNLWLALILTGVACLILGMEVPTTAAYVICISVAGPALQSLGLAPLQAHLFVFWFALLSTITPPVCGAVFIASGMVEENWLKVAKKAMLLGIGLYIIPIGMIINPELINLENDPLLALMAAIKMCLALASISFGFIALKPIAIRLSFISVGIFVLLLRIP